MKEKSDKEIILEYLQTGKSLTALDAWEKWNLLTSFRSRISDLRKDGYNIVSTLETSNNKTYARYAP